MHARPVPVCVLLAGLLLQACSQASAIPETQRIVSPPAERAEQPELAAASTLAEALEPVQAMAPRLWIRRAGDDAATTADTVGSIAGVAWAAPVQVGVVALSGTRGPGRIQLVAVDTTTFRRLTPQSTADDIDLWKRLDAGQAALSPEAAWRLDVSKGGVVSGSRLRLHVGAVAPLLEPALADMIITRDAADAVRLRGEQTVLVAVEPNASVQSVERHLGAEGFAVETLPGGDNDDDGGGHRRLEPFEYLPLDGGLIEIDPAWVRRNVRTQRVPILGAVTCHVVIFPQLRAALQEIEDRGLAHLIDRSQYGGCWTPRHIDFNPDKSISTHAWGLAVDINVSTNQLGAEPQMDPRIVESFERWGFVWGGRWSRPDGMHFQLGSIINIDDVEG